jgi:N-acetylmuramate 1-kinase
LSDTRSPARNPGTDLRLANAAAEAEIALLREYAVLLANAHGRPEIERLEGDASTRAYFRARYPDGSTVVLMRYPAGSMDDLATFLDVHTFLSERELPVPQIHKAMPQRGLVVLEDLGDVLLETLAHREDPERSGRVYGDAVDLLLQLRRATSGMRTGCVAFELAFDLEKLMQEMRFFVTHFVQGLCKAKLSQVVSETLERFFLHICSLLASEPRILAHRDYHSRNLMVVPDRLVMIDFQDARMGPAQYDLASLLRDSYVTLPEDLVDGLIDRYREGMGNARETSAERFRYVFDMMSLQRNIKALGTFGYQVSVRGSLRYASSIPRTGAYVAANMEKYDELREFRSVVDDVICGPSRYIGITLYPTP